jgi:2,4-dienoyl-CoA reductase-like NADH-dependent reductase (Old Yellow Enzyme family)
LSIYESLFRPIEVGGVTIPNRIVRSAHGTGLQGEALIAYHEARAKGGVGMSTIEATGVHPSAAIGIPLFSDDCLPFLETLATRIARYPMKMFHQLYHAGAGYGAAAGADEHWSASAVPNPMSGVMPVAMTKAMIDDVVESFARAARRVRDAGLHGVDIHASSGYLLHEFLSPALNKRTDDYGGSLENRMRFLTEVLEAVRSEVGDGAFAVGVRLPNEDYVPGGLTAEQNADIARRIEPLVDYVSLHMGAYWRFHKLIAPTDDPLGVEMPFNQVITKALTKPTIVVGRIMTLDHADHLVSSGQADMVSMVRALIADPELVAKARRGEEHKIRPCIGSNMGCVGQLMTTGRLSCVVNASAARESAVSPDPTDVVAAPRRILVVGGGPAGLEFARTAALRGHRVQLHEAMEVLGGQVAMAARAPHRADLRAITDWLAAELEALEVDVHLGSMVDANLVRHIDPDAVVVATGTMPRSDGFQVSVPAEPIAGFDLPHVASSWQLFGFGDPVRVAGPAVVYDDTGSFEALSAADALLQAGVPVTMISRFEGMGGSLPYPPVTAGAIRERLMSGDFDFIGGHHLRRITPEAVEIGVLFTERCRVVPAKTVIFVGYNEPNRDLAEELRDADYPVHLIGDVRGRNSIMSAIHAAAKLARQI